MGHRRDARLLARALGIEDTEDLASGLAAIGGLVGLLSGRGKILETLDPVASHRLSAWLKLTARMLGPTRRQVINSPEDALAYLGPFKRLTPVECFWSILLDARGRPLQRIEVAREP